MVDGLTKVRIPRRRPRWTWVVLAALAAMLLAVLLEIAESLMVADVAPTTRVVGHPNTRTLVLPLLPRP